MSEKELPNPDKMTFEQAAQELDDIVKRIDGGDEDLETMMAEHTRGQLLVQRCKCLLETAQQQIKTMEAKDLS
jgi:exodeoxyribonuclease VII small subunit